MNKSKIEWVDYTWNPVSGCYGKCPNCDVEKKLNRLAGDVRLNLADERCKRYGDNTPPLYVLDEPFKTKNSNNIPTPFGVAPTLHKYRLTWPQKLKSGANILVGAIGDMFATHIPDEWIEEVFKACEAYPQHNYLFITRNPERYNSLAREGILRRNSNFWYGSFVTNSDEDIAVSHSHTFNTYEVINPIDKPFDEDEMCTDEYIKNGNTNCTEWFVINSCESKNEEPKWLKSILVLASKCNTPVFLNSQLKSIVGEDNFVQQFPEALKRKELSPKRKEQLYTHCGKCKQVLKKSDMTAILSREKRGEGAKAVGYICKGCYGDFLKGFEANGNPNDP